MDVHRCRFVPYPASAVNAVAFSHSSLPAKKSKNKDIAVRLAIGRANGDLEIWNPLDGTWHQEIIIRGGKDRSVDSLVWLTSEDERLNDSTIIRGRSRLFSIGFTQTVTEWDLENATAKRHASSGAHGELWCLAVQPPSPKDKSQLLAAGTVDGNIILYTTEDDDLRFQRMFRLPKGSSKVVSIAFQSRHVLVAGCADSSIRVLDIRNGQVKRNMTLGRDLVSGSKNIIVWSVKCLPDGDIVSGDSTGQICIWDGKTYTQAQRIQGHTQDVLSLATSADGSTIVSGGMDRKTAVYQRSPGKAVRWTRLWHKRHHEHDVKTMASFEGNGLSVVVTGGPDAVPVVMPLAKSSLENHRRLSHLPQSLPIASAPHARLLVGWWDREVHIWKLFNPIDEVLSRDNVEQAVQKNRKLLGRIKIQGESNITSASISQDGTLLVVCTTTDIKAFRLTLPTESVKALSVSRISLPEAVAKHGATAASISPNSQWLCLANTGSRIGMVKIDHDPIDGQVSITSDPTKLKRLQRDVSKHKLLGGLGSYDRHVTYLAFSPDSKVLATVDLAGFIDTWILSNAPNGTQNGTHSKQSGDASDSSSDEESDDESSESHSGPRWIRNPKANLVPKLPHAPTAFSFSPELPSKGTNSDYVLLAIDTSAEVYALHPLQGKLTAWQPVVKRSMLPLEYRNTHDFAKGVLWQGPRIWIYGVSFILMIDTSVHKQTQEASGFWSMHQEEGTKRKRKLDSGAGGRSDLDLVPKNVSITAEEEESEDKWVRRELGDSLGKRDVDSEGDDNESDEEDDREVRKLNNQLGVQVEKRRYWHSFQYRHILGIVPLESSDAGVVQAAGTLPYPPIEVAIVERSPWDLDVAERFVSENER